MVLIELLSKPQAIVCESGGFAAGGVMRNVRRWLPIHEGALQASIPASNDASIRKLSKGRSMRTTINIDDDLLAKASKLIGPMDRTAILSESLKALIERESARRLARLGGSQPKLKAVPRRRSERAA